MSFVVSEIFGPTLQGEGPSAGRRAGFVRLGRCNLACAFCDSAWTWDWERYDPTRELREMDVDEVVARIEAMDVPLVVVTGGEPLLQQQALGTLLARLKMPVEIETAGTIAPSDELIGLGPRFNVSPKLENSGNPLGRRYKPDVLRALEATGTAVFKFVVSIVGELDEVQHIVDECGLTRVWIMPEGTDATTVTTRMQELSDPVIARGWNLTSRLHIVLWGDVRGR